MEERGKQPEYLSRTGPAVAQSPVVISVPHSGRIYPKSLLEQARLDKTLLQSLEDRLVDTLVGPLAEQGFTVIIAHAARAWIDLNRSELEIDPDMISPRPAAKGVMPSAKMRGGLGLVPRRLARHGQIYRETITASDLATRVSSVHRPYHSAVSDALRAARQRYGVAVLMDCHSMPPLKPKSGAAPAEIVLGDRRGKSAAPPFIARASHIFRNHGLRTARNTPYAGGHILARHGQAERDIHALQIELCRSLYLDARFDRPGARFDEIAAIMRDVAFGLQAEALSPPASIAAE
jgi:N-formylglutamate amidohydrolase